MSSQSSDTTTAHDVAAAAYQLTLTTLGPARRGARAIADSRPHHRDAPHRPARPRRRLRLSFAAASRYAAFADAGYTSSAGIVNGRKHTY